jgi:Fe-S cluster assembly protein SufD
VAPLVKLPFRPVFELQRDALPAKALGQFTFAGLHGSRLVFVNGHFAPELSRILPLPPGVKVTSLASALAADPARVERHLFRHARSDANAFAALNTAFFQDGAFIYVPAGQAVAEPVQLLFVSTSQENGASAHPRNLIITESGSRLTVIEHYVSTAEAPCVTNAVTELVAGDEAVVEHMKFQDESRHAFHLATLAAHFGRASNVIAHSIALGAKLSRTNIYATLAGEGLECILNGLYLTRGDQLADHYMIVEHAQPHCASHEYFNGILADRSKGVFHGRILVRPGAQKTDAKQTNKNLLLSDDATAATKPQLEIYADDVKCTHGATVGQLDEPAIFYLRSRGIGLEAARRMLIHAFAGEIVERVRQEALREELDKLVWDRLEQHERVAVNK